MSCSCRMWSSMRTFSFLIAVFNLSNHFQHCTIKPQLLKPRQHRFSIERRKHNLSWRNWRIRGIHRSIHRTRWLRLSTSSRAGTLDNLRLPAQVLLLAKVPFFPSARKSINGHHIVGRSRLSTSEAVPSSWPAPTKLTVGAIPSAWHCIAHATSEAPVHCNVLVNRNTSRA